MDTYELIAIKNEQGERKLIRKDDFDPEEHEQWDESEAQPDTDNGDESPDSNSDEQPSDGNDDTQRQFGQFKAVENEQSPGWWNVMHTETKEIQNDKNLREAPAIEMAKNLADNA